MEKPVISLGSHGPAGPFLTWSQLSVAGPPDFFRWIFFMDPNDGSMGLG